MDDEEGLVFLCNQGLELGQEAPSQVQDQWGIMFLCHFIEELDDVCKVHFPIENNVPVGLDQRQSDKEIEVRWYHMLWSPYGLPHHVSVPVRELPLEIQKEPPADEIRKAM